MGTFCAYLCNSGHTLFVFMYCRAHSMRIYVTHRHVLCVYVSLMGTFYACLCTSWAHSMRIYVTHGHILCMFYVPHGRIHIRYITLSMFADLCGSFPLPSSKGGHTLARLQARHGLPALSSRHPMLLMYLHLFPYVSDRLLRTAGVGRRLLFCCQRLAVDWLLD